MYIVGVDTGGTKTKCIVLNQAYDLLGTGSSGPGNYHVAGVDGAKDNVETAIQQALSNAGLDTTAELIGGFGMGTLDTAEDRSVITGFLDDIDCIDRYILENDVITAHHALTAGDPGITVVAGTGAMAYGIGTDGTDSRASGWGWLLGDEGSGFYAARRGLQEATRAYDGRGEQTALVEAACEHFELPEFEEIFQMVYQELNHPKNIAPFAEDVTEAARTGDEVAQRIIADAADELADAALAVYHDLQLDSPVPIGCVGGFGTNPVVASEFETRIKERLPAVEFLTPVDHPVVGTVMLVADALDQSIDRATLHTIDEEIDRLTDE